MDEWFELTQKLVSEWKKCQQDLEDERQLLRDSVLKLSRQNFEMKEKLRKLRELTDDNVWASPEWRKQFAQLIADPADIC